MRILLVWVAALAAAVWPSLVSAEIRFQEISAAAGTTVEHDNLGHDAAGDYGQNLYGSGVAFEDVNADGWPDLLLGNGGAGKRVFLNNGDGTFEDRSAWFSRLPSSTSTGMAMADIQNDGFLDLFMPNYYHEPFFFRGNGNSLSQLATQFGVSPLMFRQGEEPEGWFGPNSMGVGFGDLDRDGYVDIYVANYQPNREDILFQSSIGSYFNRTDDIKVEGSRLSPGFQPVFLDLDDDGDLDIYISNDFAPNFYFENNTGGGINLEEKSRNYKINGNQIPVEQDHVMSMGVAVGDFDNDLDLDIYVANYIKNALYVNPGGPGPNTTFFTEEAQQHGIRYQKNSWGTGFFDADNDGDLDLALVGGWIPSDPILDQGTLIDNRFFRNDGGPDWKYTQITEAAGFTDTQAGRGLAMADFDRDGKVDMASWNASMHDPNPVDTETFHLGEFRLYENVDDGPGHWVGLKLTGLGVVDDVVHSNRAAIGARAYVTTTDGMTRMREVRAGESYLSHNSLELEFGLGTASAIQEVRVRWATGEEEVFSDVAIDAYQELIENSGAATQYGVLIPKVESSWTGIEAEVRWNQAKWLRPEGVQLERALDDGEEPDFVEVTASKLSIVDGVGSVSDETVENDRAYLYRLTIRSHDGRFEEGTIAGVTTGAPTLPTQPQLLQNFPNPFNPSTMLTFELPAAANATMRLFDLRGRRVATLFDGPAPAGPTNVEFEGFDENGNPVASGTYIYVLDTEGGSQSRRMTLIR